MLVNVHTTQRHKQRSRTLDHPNVPYHCIRSGREPKAQTFMESAVEPISCPDLPFSSYCGGGGCYKPKSLRFKFIIVSYFLLFLSRCTYTRQRELYEFNISMHSLKCKHMLLNHRNCPSGSFMFIHLDLFAIASFLAFHIYDVIFKYSQLMFSVLVGQSVSL